MNASMQWNLGAAELGLVLALVRGGNLAAAAQLAGVDGSTVFRTVQRAEKALGQRLFERSRSGYQPTELHLSMLTRLGARMTMANVAFDDHPNELRFSSRIRTVTVDSVFAWLQRSGLAREEWVVH